MKKSFLLVSLVLLLCQCSLIKSRAASDEMTVMTFNLRYGTAKDGENRWELRQPILMEYLRKEHPDFLATQEALPFQIQAIQDEFPQWSSIGQGRYFGKEMPDRPHESLDGESCRIFYAARKFELMDQGTYWHSEHPDEPASISWGNTLPRITTWGLFRSRSTGRSFVFMNTHFHGGEPYVSRTTQLVIDKWREIAADLPTLFTGDFNLPPGSETHRRLCSGPGTEAGSRYFIDTWQALNKPESNAGTGHGFKGVRDQSRIDWILCTDEFKVQKSEILYHQRNGRYPSDHYPVLAKLKW
ncbi:MAG TPA: endonuclease/exonuclease/phosphatase family protein [bacterium]|nr:endonuclease/exonuclease/phosphatase family protein [bacterium]